MRKLISRIPIVITIAACTWVAACGDSPKPRSAATTEPVAAAPIAAPVTAAVEVTAPVEYTFDTSLRDPFKPTTPTISPGSDDTDCGPLCSFDVSQFRVKGIIWGIAQPTAMIFSPENKPYIVKIGSPIGKNKGKVVSIIKDRIAIVEKYVNYRGEVVTNRVDIELASEGGARK